MKNMPKSKKIIILIVLALLIGSVLLYVKNKTPYPEKAQKMQMMENKKTLESVQKLMIIPNEDPIIATINEAETLIKEQAFYANSQNGDKLIIFPKAKKAVIYSPKDNKVVNSGPFSINNPAPVQ